MQVNMHQAKTQLSYLVESARRGEEVYIARNGVPVAKLVPVRTGRGKRVLGSGRKWIDIKDAFYKPMSEKELKEFLGV